MTIIDDLLVLLDDRESRSLEDVAEILSDRSKQTLSSTLGRLVAKGWVERTNRRPKRLYQISRSGQERVTGMLEQIKQRVDAPWDGTWELVVFNIPERERKRRDDLRKLLVSLGYGRLHNSLWLSPWSHQSELATYLKETKSDGDVSVLVMSTDTAASERIAKHFEWDWTALDAAYQRFMKAAETFLGTSAKNVYEARRLVYQYAKTLNGDPKLPAVLPQRSKLAAKAQALYEKVRPYCYKG